MKKKVFTISLELTPNQVVRFNELLNFLKVRLTQNSKEAESVFQQPPKEFVEKILELQPLKESGKSITENVKLYESEGPSDFEVKVQDIVNLLHRER